jgi:hypothetical protein
VRSGSREAWFAMGMAALAVTATPIDVLLTPFERQRYARTDPPRRPLIFVCGPPRSGTTVVAQTLIRFLPVAYLNNLTGVFPRAPLSANRLLGMRPRNDDIGFDSYYGRTAKLWGPNDGLPLWDRWLGSNRTVAPASLSDEQAEDLTRFFGAFEALVHPHPARPGAGGRRAPTAGGAQARCQERSTSLRHRDHGARCWQASATQPLRQGRLPIACRKKLRRLRTCCLGYLL